MHLLNARTYALETFPNAASRPRYAILSHTWTESEVTYQDITHIEDARGKAEFVKIRHTCEQAIKNGITYVWVDTCCIDKSSSTELSEAINSMFSWYEQSAFCYVYLTDVQLGPEEQATGPDLHVLARDEQSSTTARFFASSRWFTRGWTLQELLAPRNIVFYDHSWKAIGPLDRLVGLVSRITSIPVRVLNKRARIASFSIAQRMSWAANRNTTRIEDRAYSLLGLFEISMPLLYGEGARAFQRLQEEIIKATTDHSFLLWGVSVDYDGLGRPRETSPKYEAPYNGTIVTVTTVDAAVTTPSILAKSPSEFVDCGSIAQLSANVNDPSQATYSLTNYGLQMKLPILRVVHPGLSVLAILSCYDEHDMVAPVCLVLEPVESQSKRQSNTFMRGPRIRTTRSIAELEKATLESIIIVRETPILDFRLNVRYFDCRKRTGDSMAERWRFQVGSVADPQGWNPEGVNFFGHGQDGTGFDLEIRKGGGNFVEMNVTVSGLQSHYETPGHVRFYRMDDYYEFESVESPWDACVRLNTTTYLAAQTVVNSPLVLLKLFLIDPPGSSWAKAIADTFPSLSTGRNQEQQQHKQISQSSMFAKFDPREIYLT